MEEMNEQPVVEQEETTQAEEPTIKSEVLEDGTYRVGFPTTEETPEVTEPPVEEEPQVEQDVPVLQEVTDEPEPQAVVEQEEQPTVEAQPEVTPEQPKMELPEGIEKLIEFMEETGGTIEDYARLNADYGSLEEKTLLSEYYKATKPHLSKDEIDFLIDDKFSYDEEMDEERDIKRKQLAYKEELAQAKNHLDGMKSKYYQDLKLGSRLTPEQQKAVEFFDRYSKEQKSVEELTTKAMYSMFSISLLEKIIC
jgi:hypothetical protein